MKKHLFLLTFSAVLVACGPSQAEFDAVQCENVNLRAKVDSLNKELDAYKYAPAKMLAQARQAAKEGRTSSLTYIYSQIKKYHPQSAECNEVQKLVDASIANERAKVEAERKKQEKDKQERLKLVRKLKKERDDVQNITWYYNPYFTHYNDKNLVSLYMGETASSLWLRLKMSYSGDSWIFFEHAYLSYDGITREITFDKYRDKKSDNYTYVWEWIDVSVSQADLIFLKAMVNGKSVKMRLSGKYSKTRNVTASEIKAIKEMITAYEVLNNEK